MGGFAAGAAVDNAGWRALARSRSPADAGSCCVSNVVGLITDGLSRNFTYSGPTVGCGTGSADPKNPSGTCTGWANPGSLDTESTRNRLVPESLHASSGVDGHARSFSTGRRTRLPKGCQSPGIPLATTRNCKSPNAEVPNAFAGLTVATATCAFSSVMPPLTKLNTVADDPSPVATSMLSSRPNTAGHWERTA